MIHDSITLAAGTGFGMRMLDPQKRGTAFPETASEGDLWELTELVGESVPAVYEFSLGEWVFRSPSESFLPYDVSGTILGRPEPDSKVMFFVAPRSFYIQASFAGAIAKAEAPPTDFQDFYVMLLRGDTPVSLGTIRFAPGEFFGQFINVNPASQLVRRGDTISVITAPNVDQVIGDISFTLCGFISA